MKKVIGILGIAMLLSASAFAMGDWFKPATNQKYQYQIVPACTAPGVVNYTMKNGAKILNPPYRNGGKCDYSVANADYAWEQGSYPTCYNPKLSEVKPC